MHCGATARVSSIWKHLLIISMLILGKWLILQQLQDNQAGGWNQSVGSSTLNLIASNKPRATGTVLILWRSPLPSVPRSQFGDCRFPHPQPMMFSGQQESAYYVGDQRYIQRHQWWTTGGRDHKPLFWWWTVISFSQSDALQPARSPLFSVSVNDDDQQAERSSRVLCQWTYGWNRYRPC
jgi:hypothetical protein